MLITSLALCAALSAQMPERSPPIASDNQMTTCEVIPDLELSRIRGAGYAPEKKLRELITELIRHDAYAHENIAMIQAFDWSDWMSAQLSHGI